MPPESDAARMRLQIEGGPEREVWRRWFESHEMITTQYEGPGGALIERAGLVELRLALTVSGGALVYRQTGARLRLGPLALPIPAAIAPRVSAKEAPGDVEGRMSVLVVTTLPVIGELLRYSGWIAVQEEGS